jgi:hypothetical protein
MKVFISWSGDVSHRIALELRMWLPTVIHSLDTWVSSEDILKGSRWSVDLADALGQCDFGLICLVPANIEEPWLNFEAGVISKSLSVSRVCPFVFGIKPRQLSNSPLGQFQCAEYSQADVRKLVHTLNSHGDKIPSDRLDRTFDACWPVLEGSLNQILPTDLPLSGGHAKYLRGRAQIYAHAVYLLRLSEQRVRVLQFFGGPRPPETYAEEVAKILRSKREAGTDVTYDSYLAISPRRMPPDFAELNQRRFDIYAKQGVGHLVALHLLEMEYPDGYGFDMFIVDRKHAHISFTTSERLADLQRGIAFEDQEPVVNDLAE